MKICLYIKKNSKNTQDNRLNILKVTKLPTNHPMPY